mmetsp:Transcript_15989/g.26341  ORF Transcript_15989/g.26341 Transcript_15989/m.26341 type:complete len:96 (+) Transcript_15989:226-513(+)
MYSLEPDSQNRKRMITHSLIYPTLNNGAHLVSSSSGYAISTCASPEMSGNTVACSVLVNITFAEFWLLNIDLPVATNSRDHMRKRPSGKLYNRSI